MSSRSSSLIERRKQQPLKLRVRLPDHHHRHRSMTNVLYSPSSSSSSETSSYSPLLHSDLEKLSIIGHGNDGTVYKVLHKQTGNIYALKHIRCGAEHESEIMQRVSSSEYVVGYHGVLSDGSLLMEYMNGGSLHDILLLHKSLPERIISGLMRSVLMGLLHIHGHQVVHGDIKPSNILLNGNGEVKIADFGASRVVSVGDAVWEYGTFAYMSPERMDPDRWWGGEQCQGYAGDVWALGVVAMECHVGRFPFVCPGENVDWMTMICTVAVEEEQEFADVTKIGSPEFESFRRRCLVRDWRKRGTVEELLMHPFIQICKHHEDGIQTDN